MLFRWLLNDLPDELRSAWRLVHADLLTWLLLSVAMGLLAAMTRSAESVRPEFGLAGAVFALFVVTLVVVKFDAADRGLRAGPAEVLRCLLRRGLLLFPAVLASVGLSTLAGMAVRTVAGEALASHEHGALLATTLGIAVYVAILTRFSFVPMLVLLGRPHSPEAAPRRITRWAGALVGSLPESARMTRGRWPRLLPYVLVLSAAPPRAIVATQWLPLLLALWQMIQLLAQAALFRHYRGRAEGPPGTSP
jgi:hypothetical protein